MEGPFRALIVDNDVDADKWYVLVDLSNTSEYPHKTASSLVLHGIELQTEKKTDSQFDIYIGCVVENDATDGSAEVIWKWSLEAVGNPTDSTDRCHDELDWTSYYPLWRGLPLSLNTTADTLDKLTCNSTALDDKTDLQNDAGNLTDGYGNTDVSAGEGDIVVFVDETGGSGTISMSVAAIYSTI